MATTASTSPTIKKISTTVYKIPTDKPEADGTLNWDSTTVVLVQLEDAAGTNGLGFTYGAAQAAGVIEETLTPIIREQDLEDINGLWKKMVAAVRNIGRPGIAACAISAVDVALWDLKARQMEMPLFQLLGPQRNSVPIYGSGGFTSYSEAELIAQLGGWVSEGISKVKMKIGTNWGEEPEKDIARVAALRQALGEKPEIFVDANGAFGLSRAVEVAKALRDLKVTYFEEPVSSDQLEQLATVRTMIDIPVAAGEYGYDPWYFQNMVRAEAVDILQADVTRCCGITGWLAAAAIADGHHLHFSAHTAPSIHAHCGCAAPRISHVEYFHDHVRIEQMLFDGAARHSKGQLLVDPSRPGLGLELKKRDADRWLQAA